MQIKMPVIIKPSPELVGRNKETCQHSFKHQRQKAELLRQQQGKYPEFVSFGGVTTEQSGGHVDEIAGFCPGPSAQALWGPDYTEYDPTSGVDEFVHASHHEEFYEIVDVTAIENAMDTFQDDYEDDCEDDCEDMIQEILMNTAEDPNIEDFSAISWEATT